jgi:hypothetical protein
MKDRDPIADIDLSSRGTMPEHHYSPAAGHTELVHEVMSPGSTIEAGLRIIAGCRFIPSELAVFGSMDISLNPTLERIDNNLRIVGGSLIASNSTKLRSIGEGLIVDEDCLLDGCSELASLGPNIKVGRDLDLSRCPHVMLSAHVTVGRNLLLLSGYELSLLPADLAVGGKLIRS